MFQLSPVSFKPVVRASQEQHLPFMRKLIKLIEETAEETEVVDLGYAKSKELLNCLDSFMSYGLYAGDKAYWVFVKEFLPKSEANLLKVEWQCMSNRALSVAWLKDALNRGALHFQLLAFAQSRQTICRFYHPNACLRNWVMLDRISSECEKLTKVQFAFNSPSVARQEFVPTAVVVEASPMTAPTQRRRRPMRELASQRDMIPDNRGRPLPTQLDQEYMLNELIMQRRNRFFSVHETDDNKNRKPEHESSVSAIEEARDNAGIDDVIKKTMSAVSMATLNDFEPRSLEKIFSAEDMKRAQKDLSFQEERFEGEIRLKQGQVLKLAMDVFVQQEKLHKTYLVYDGFAVGKPSERLLVVTNKNIYSLTESLSMTNANSRAGEDDALASGSVEYNIHWIANMDIIDYVAIGDDMQCIQIFAKKGTEFSVFDDSASKTVLTFATCEIKLGQAISYQIVEAARKGSDSKDGVPSVFSDNTAYALLVRRLLTRELNTTVDALRLQNTSFVYWRETSRYLADAEVEYSGYLYYKPESPSWWKKSTELIQGYFMLRGQKLYIFTDSSCKVGSRVLNLSGGAVETREVKNENGHVSEFEITFPLNPEETPILLASMSREETQKWLNMISIALSAQADGSDVTSCAAVVTETHIVIYQEGAKALMDNFTRCLLRFPLELIEQGIILSEGPHTAILLVVGDMIEWFFFRSMSELERMRAVISKYIPCADISTYAEEDKNRIAILTHAHRTRDLWKRTVFGCENPDIPFD